MRVAILTIVVLLPATVTAQQTGIRVSLEREATLVASSPSTTAPERDPRADAEQQRAPEARPAAGPRRRPSMVGYIGDASIGSQIRVRFDAGFEMTAADRAEFFYGKCGCYRALPPGHAAYDPDAPGPGPGAAVELDFSQVYVLGEYAFNGRTSVYGDIPIRWVRPEIFVNGTGTYPNAGGLSDIRGGVKVALSATPDRYVTVQLQADAPTGKASKGLGTDHWSISPALLYYQRVGERVAVESQFGSSHPIGGSAGIPTDSSKGFAGSVLTYGVGTGVELLGGGRMGVAPVVEVLAWHVLDGFQTATLGEADGIDIVNLKIGVRFTYGDRGSAYLGYGRALTDAKWYHDIFRAEYRYGF